MTNDELGDLWTKERPDQARRLEVGWLKPEPGKAVYTISTANELLLALSLTNEWWYEQHAPGRGAEQNEVTFEARLIQALSGLKRRLKLTLVRRPESARTALRTALREQGEARGANALSDADDAAELAAEDERLAGEERDRREVGHVTPEHRERALTHEELEDEEEDHWLERRRPE